MRKWYIETRVPIRFPGEGHIEALVEQLPEEKDLTLFPYIPIKEGDTIDLGNRILEIYETPGHSPGHVSYLDRANRLLFSGDTINDSIIIFNKEGGNREAGRSPRRVRDPGAHPHRDPRRQHPHGGAG